MTAEKSFVAETVHILTQYLLGLCMSRHLGENSRCFPMEPDLLHRNNENTSFNTNKTSEKPSSITKNGTQ